MYAWGWELGTRSEGGKGWACGWRHEARLVNGRTGRKFRRGAKPRALPMPPTAQEMASELHA